jgi:hypothetical protein
MGGKLVRKIAISGTSIKAASGITFATGIDGSPSRLYISDRDVDNNFNPAENDGKTRRIEDLVGPTLMWVRGLQRPTVLPSTRLARRRSLNTCRDG